MAQYELLACPFCGNAPEAFGSGEGRRGLMIECVTQGCVNPHTSYYDRPTAAATWNRRIISPAPTTHTDTDINATSPL